MLVRLTKHESRPHTLECVRDDGTRTWFTSRANSDFFAIHDLIHFAVESNLGYKNAFYGMVAGGRDLDDFGTQSGSKDEREFHPEAIHAEQLVGILLNAPCDTYSDFLDRIEQVYAGSTDQPEFQEREFDAIKTSMNELIARWRSLPFEGALELGFG